MQTDHRKLFNTRLGNIEIRTSGIIKVLPYQDTDDSVVIWYKLPNERSDTYILSTENMIGSTLIYENDELKIYIKLKE